MTIVGFSVQRVIMAALKVKQQQQIRQKTAANYEILEEILQGIILGVEDQKYNFEQYVKAGRNEGLDESEIWKLAKQILSSHVSMKTLYNWGHEFLTEEAFNSIKQKAANLSHNRYASAVNLQQAIKEHIECESCAEAYEIDKIRSGAYSYEYLQSVAVWLHECLEINCRGK